MRKAICWASLGCLVCLHTQLAWGARRGFRPQLAQLTAALQFQGEYRQTREENSTTVRLQKSNDMRETIMVQAVGFSYSPRFFIFSLGGSLGLGQSESDSENTQSTRKSSVEEYQFQGVFLPEHPYSLEITSFREVPLFSSNYSTLKTTSMERSGLALRYKQKPYFGELRYDYSTREGDIPSFFEIFQGYAEYFTDDFITGMTMLHSIDTVEDEALKNSSLNGYVQLSELFAGKGDYSGNWAFNKNKQEGTESRSGSLRHNLLVDIFDDLSGTFELVQDQQAQLWAGGGGQEDAFSGQQDARAVLTHQLFQSLTTSLSGRERIRRASDSKNRNQSFSLTSTYKKRILGSNRFTLRGGVASTNTWNDIVEGGVAFKPEYFVEARELEVFTTPADIDVDTLQVAVLRDPILRDDYVELVEHEHYKILKVRSDGALDIQLLRVPGGIDPIKDDPEKIFKIRLVYEYIKSDVDTKTFAWNYASKLELLDNFLALYYQRKTTSQERLSLQPSQTRPEETIFDDSVGVSIFKEPFAATWEYSRILGDPQSLRKWSVYASMSDEVRLSKYLALEMGAFLNNSNIIEDRSGDVMMPDYNLMVFSSHLALNTELPSLDANLKCGISYLHDRGLKERILFDQPNFEGQYLRNDEMTRTVETQSSLRNYIVFSGAIPERRLFYSLMGGRTISSGIDQQKIWDATSRIRYELGLVKMKLTLKYSSRERDRGENDTTTSEETGATLMITRDIH